MLGQHLFAAPLGGSFLHVAAGGGAGIPVCLVLFAVLALVGAISRRIAIRRQLVDPAAPA